MNGCLSKLGNIVSGVPQGSVLSPLFFLLFFILENKLIGYADDSTLMGVVPTPGIKVAVAESHIRDLIRVSEWCDLWGMKLNADKTKTMIVSRSRTMHPQSPPLTIGGTELMEPDDLVMTLPDPEWPHRQCVSLAFRRSQVRISVSAVSLVICCPH